MLRCIISFNEGGMKFPEAELPQVAEGSHGVVREAKEAGVWIFGGGFFEDRPSVIDEDEGIEPGPLKASEVRLG